MIDLELFKKLVSYNPETGIFTWTDAHKVSTIRGLEAGSCCSHAGQKAYMEIAVKFNYKRQRAKSHRLAWYFMTGHFPERGEEIDHIDGNGMNNQFSNLRLVSRMENCRNQRLRSDNKSGHCGVIWYKRDQNWQVEINSGKNKLFLGRYKDLDEAIRVRKAAELKYNFHPNHGAVRPLYAHSTSNEAAL